MAQPTHTVAIAFVRSAVRALEAQARLAALREAGIAPELLAVPAARVPAPAFATLWLAVARILGDEFFGLDARSMKPGSFALLCHALAGCGTVGRGLERALRGFSLFLDDIDARLVVESERARIVISNRIGAVPDTADARRFADETLLVMLHGLMCWLAGRRVTLDAAQWAHPTPPHADEYRRMFSPQLAFDAAATAIDFDARLLAAPAASSPSALKAFLRDAPQSVFLKQTAGPATSDLVRRRCRQALARGEAPPSLDVLAADLNLSPATLRRRLVAEGANWQAVKDDERRRLALARLAAGGTTVAALAEQLGFQDARTLYRAFRKWTGQAPGTWKSR